MLLNLRVPAGNCQDTNKELSDNCQGTSRELSGH